MLHKTTGKQEFMQERKNQPKPENDVDRGANQSYVAEVKQPSFPFVLLRTVPVILTNGNRRIKVNALLDEASTQTYLNEDVNQELGLSGELERMTINVLNDNKATLNTMRVTCELKSLDGRVQQAISVLTTRKVTGNL